jgi:hypothetical protein
VIIYMPIWHKGSGVSSILKGFDNDVLYFKTVFSSPLSLTVFLVDLFGR